MYEVVLSKEAEKDFWKLKAAKLLRKPKMLIALLEKNPFETPPHYEKLLGDLRGQYSRRINLQHRLVYEVNEAQKIVKVTRMWTHYE